MHPGSLRTRRRATLVRPVCIATVALVVSALLQTASEASAPVFADGFESGNLSSWTAFAGMTDQQQIVYDGAWAARATGNGTAAYAYKRLSTTYAELYYRVEVNVFSNSTPVQLIGLRVRGGSVIFALGVNKAGKLYGYNAATKSTLTTSSDVSRNSWHELELHVLVSGSSSREDVWLDGNPIAGLSKSDSLGTTPIGRLSLGQTGKNHTFDAAFDGVVADTSFIGSNVDGESPTQPSGLDATTVKSHAVDLSWNASQDNVDVSGYTVYRSDDNGTSYTTVGTSSTTSYTDTTASPATSYRYRVDAFDAAGNHSAVSDPIDVVTPAAFSTPIRHVVVIDQENHSFDNVLGRVCADIASGVITTHQPCDGATSGTTSTGDSIPLTSAADIVAPVSHSVAPQQIAINNGAMNGFDQIGGCSSSSGYACYSQYDPLSGPCGASGTETCIPNLASLAENFVISDRTFEFATTPSWGGHMVLASSTLDGFTGDNPKPSTFTSQRGPGWGCDGYKDALWWDGAQYVLEPSCIPDKTGAGPYRSSPVPYVPTIFDRLDDAGLSWKIYGGSGDTGSGGGWDWAICPTFYECLGSGQRNNLVAASNVVTDASAGDLPSYAIVTPTGVNSQHNKDSMAVGDNWIGQVVSAIENGPDWASTAIFITYDDCGCFYDHVAPPHTDWGVRVPMVIVSPFAKPGYTDSTPATYSSMMAYAEDIFGLAPLAAADQDAYDYSDSFNYAQTPVAPFFAIHTRVSRAERRYIAAHPSAEGAT